MRRATIGTLLVATALLTTPAQATITLELRVDADVRDAVPARIVVKNLGDEPAEGVVPTATLAGATARGEEPESLPPGFTVSWDLTLPRPAGAGTFPLVVELAYADAFGHAFSAPAVHLVRTPGAGGPMLDVAVEPPPPLLGAGTATVRITSRAAERIAGTLHLVSGRELSVTPAERPIDIAAGATTAVPITVATHDAIPGSTTALYAYVTTDRDGRRDAAVGSAVVAIGTPRTESDGSGLVLVAAALGVAGLLAAARRWLVAAPRTGARAARRRADR